ncbi:hypothetical protein VNI00_011150 [Paramarasmius palmivorus]|uniref:N-acetyltransferase domain-containing protein n=1 Tax=Paramarasmius palmivorus TaxID=297713 RepID=A0AAW0CEX3_9AGAR
MEKKPNYSVLQPKVASESQVAEAVQVCLHSFEPNDIAIQTLAGGTEAEHTLTFFRTVLQSSARNEALFVAVTDDPDKKIIGVAAWLGAFSEKKESEEKKPEKEVLSDVSKFQVDTVKLLKERTLSSTSGESRFPWYLNVLAVHPEYQKLGIGRAFIEEARRRAQGVDVLLHTSSEGNVQVYTRLGFTLEGKTTITGPYGEFDMFLMSVSTSTA